MINRVAVALVLFASLGAAQITSMPASSGGGGGAPTGSASGDLSGSYPAPTVSKINGTALSGLATGILKNTTTTGVPSVAAAGTDYVAPSTTVAGHALSGNVTVACADLSNGATSCSTDTTNAGNIASGLLGPTYGGSGVNNGSKTLTLGGSVIFSGAFSPTFAIPSSSTWTFPAAGTLIGSADTGTVTNGMLAGSIAASKLTGTDIATVGTITSGTWNGAAIQAAYGGAPEQYSTITLSDAPGATIAQTTMFTPASAGRYRLIMMISQINQGTGCTGVSTLQPYWVYTDGWNSTTYYQNVFSYDFTATGSAGSPVSAAAGNSFSLGFGGVNTIERSAPWDVYVQASTAIAFGALYTHGSGCSVWPGYRIQPLVQGPF